ncbi:MAG: large subunit ribosomal protein L21 [candidate division WWE3 bacterium GW2011_GWC1_41_7]|uniref:Large ribosomal subunit protein bL21 n=3 Tax=Katanobacteria TaxID=422282 RepID=A0A0G0X5I5_UNCKA|nr:MAG: 50S ribosomal protein L21 [candidate division WWE3 bacterium GW2011_GWB1_41_6]KKS20324.1 MAG: large subunit ribosomal protein L21 [candidate division WWE3 bacterium GW2011_GWC1_41_7]OGC56787.1 MAG: 50S ribosomal protein L21 [candidate division WWE3 bacterium RIFCSPLOWO2_01_FULL_41_9]
MKYAIVRLGGKQHKVTEGETLRIERQGKLNFDILMYSDGSEIILGTPLLKDIKVKVSLVSEELGKKVRVARFKSKSRYTKTKGHRQPISIIKIDEISKAGETSKKAMEKSAKEEKPVVKAEVKKTAAAKKPATKKTTKPAAKSSKGKEKA